MPIRRLIRRASTSLVPAAALAACASHNPTPETTPAALAALHADLRMVGGETTWVTHGHDYELVGRTRADLAAVQPALDRAAAFLAQAYPNDSLPTIIAKVRRAPAPGKPFVAAAPVPIESKSARVELVIFDAKAMEAQRKKGDGPTPGEGMGMGMGMRGGSIATPAVRAWLSARAAKLTGAPSRLDQSSGESDDPRVPAWATEMISGAGNEAMIDEFTKSLAAHEETVLPLSEYFTMARPGPMEMAAGRRGGDSRGPGGDGPAGGGMGGGMGGGRGGMGGGRGGMRGGMGGGGFPGGGRGARGGSGERTFPLQGLALFAAQSAVLTKYFARSGADVVGALIDAEIMGKPIEPVFASRNMGTVQQVDAYWRGWLSERGAVLNRQ